MEGGGEGRVGRKWVGIGRFEGGVCEGGGPQARRRGAPPKRTEGSLDRRNRRSACGPQQRPAQILRVSGKGTCAFIRAAFFKFVQRLRSPYPDPQKAPTQQLSRTRPQNIKALPYAKGRDV